VQGEGHFLLGVLRGGQTLSGVSKERVTLWSGCIGRIALAGFSGQSHEWDGATPSPSGEPTTLKRSGEVIVGYTWASPFINATTTEYRFKPFPALFNPHVYAG